MTSDHAQQICESACGYLPRAEPADPITVARESLALLSMATDVLANAAAELEWSCGQSHPVAKQCRDLRKRIGEQCGKWQGEVRSEP